MKLLLSRTGLIASLVFSLFIAVGCTSAPGPDLGPRATSAEVTKHVSGNFFAFQKGGTYFDPDGTYKMILGSGDSITIGKWFFMHKTVLCQEGIHYYSDGGKTKSINGRSCSELRIQPDGTSISEGIFNGKVVDFSVIIAAPVRGFPLQSKFNSLRRSLGV